MRCSMEILRNTYGGELLNGVINTSQEYEEEGVDTVTIDLLYKGFLSSNTTILLDKN